MLRGQPKTPPSGDDLGVLDYHLNVHFACFSTIMFIQYSIDVPTYYDFSLSNTRSVSPPTFCLLSKCALQIISRTLLESAVRSDIQPKSSRSLEAEPSGIWMTEGGKQARNRA